MQQIDISKENFNKPDSYLKLDSGIGEPLLVCNHNLKIAAKQASAQGHNRVLAIVLATKPCFYKLWGVMQKAKEKELPFVIFHSGQHYDDTLAHGFKEFEFDKNLAVDLQLRGDLSQKTAELYVKGKSLAKHLKENYPNTLFVPYINGDTITAGHFGSAWLFATNKSCIQGEAGLRSMSPVGFRNLSPHLTPVELVDIQWNGDWFINRSEPFPEQYDTFVSAASCEYHFAPVELNKEHLVREAYHEKNVFVVGNTVVDAAAAKLKEKPKMSVFEVYPKLSAGKWIRMDIHRRENLNKKRFTAIIDTIVSLVERGHHVAFIELNATTRALEQYGLRNKLEKLVNRPNFFMTPVWKEYGHVIEFLESDNCWGILTDSGSMQEEMNILGKPCLTIRFSSDRPETILAKSNLLIPPLDPRQMTALIEFVMSNEKIISTMKNAPKLYGENVSEKIVDIVKDLFEKKDPFFSWAHDKLKIYKEEESMEYL